MPPSKHKPNWKTETCDILCCFVEQLEEVLSVDTDSPVRYSSEVVLYVDKYEIVWIATSRRTNDMDGMLIAARLYNV